MSEENLEIIFKKEVVIIRTMDKVGCPIEIHKFEKGSLSKNDNIFIENMLSMAKCMTSKKDKQ